MVPNVYRSRKPDDSPSLCLFGGRFRKPEITNGRSKTRRTPDTTKADPR